MLFQIPIQTHDMQKQSTLTCPRKYSHPLPQPERPKLRKGKYKSISKIIENQGPTEEDAQAGRNIAAEAE